MQHLPRRDYPTLTSLRFPAALWILMHHVVPGWMGLDFFSLPPPVVMLMSWAIVTIPFFFALSGYILYLMYAGNFPGPRIFFRNRLARVGPAYYLSLALGLPLVWPKGFLYLLGNLLCLGAWVPILMDFNPGVWTLGIEIFFYLLFPLLLPLFARASRRGAFFLLGLSFFSAALPPVLGEIFLGPLLAHWPQLLYDAGLPLTDFLRMIPLFHVGVFCFGMALARLFELRGGSYPAGKSDLLLSGGILSVVLLCLFGPGQPLGFLGSFSLLPSFAAMLLGASGPRTRWLQWLEHPFMVALGDASLAIYVLHLPLLMLTVSLREAYFPGLSLALLTPLFLVVTIFLSLFTARYFERPARALLRR